MIFSKTCFQGCDRDSLQSRKKIHHFLDWSLVSMDLPEYLNLLFAKEKFADSCAQLKELAGVAGAMEKDYITDKVAAGKKLVVGVGKKLVVGVGKKLAVVELGD